jgi:uncharacterized Zn-binding protein involved in type VI secretion
MARDKRSVEAEARRWQLGRRLSRNDSGEQGTVIEADRSIKVNGTEVARATFAAYQPPSA